MEEQGADTDPKITECIYELQSKIPVAEHGALQLRLQELKDDPDADDDDVIRILRREFDPR